MNLNLIDKIAEAIISKLIGVTGEEHLPQINAEERYVIVRTHSAGVHAGWLKSRKGEEVVLGNARRLWNWNSVSGKDAVALNGVATYGLQKTNSKVDVALSGNIVLTNAIEIIDCTETSKKSIMEFSNE